MHLGESGYCSKHVYFEYISGESGTYLAKTSLVVSSHEAETNDRHVLQSRRSEVGGLQIRRPTIGEVKRRT